MAKHRGMKRPSDAAVSGNHRLAGGFESSDDTVFCHLGSQGQARQVAGLKNEKLLASPMLQITPLGTASEWTGRVSGTIIGQLSPVSTPRAATALPRSFLTWEADWPSPRSDSDLGPRLR